MRLMHDDGLDTLRHEVYAVHIQRLSELLVALYLVLHVADGLI